MVGQIVPETITLLFGVRSQIGHDIGTFTQLYVRTSEVVVAIYLVLLLVVAKIAHSRKRRATASAGEAWTHSR